jgi:hypothetical protein
VALTANSSLSHAIRNANLRQIIQVYACIGIIVLVDVLPDKKATSRVPPEGMALSAACQSGEISSSKRDIADGSAS